MPGHKGRPLLGWEPWDLTEVEGADVLYSPEGILAESEANATALFGSAHSFYSTEGSTLCIKAMLALATAGKGDRPLILAARNAHKALIYAAALLDLRIGWLDSEEGGHLCRCPVTPETVRRAIEESEERPAAVYLTSPDYLGNLTDVAAIAKVCQDRGIPLLVDNAHGAYLKFLKPSLHPLDLGAAMCCDSAHKTLPVLTGGAYLHVAHGFEEYARGARAMLSLFASTSPSYLILQSLDLCNRILSEDYGHRLEQTVCRLDALKARLIGAGRPVEETESLKLVISGARWGYRGDELAALLRKRGIECEFADGEYLVLMATPENREEDFCRLERALWELPLREPLAEEPLPRRERERRCSERIRRGMLSPRETVSVRDAVGRICATPTVSCPPAVPIAVSGDVITKEDVALFLRYGIEEIDVIR
jgi:arginine/lysine/ornithine decarboxylase